MVRFLYLAVAVVVHVVFGFRHVKLRDGATSDGVHEVEGVPIFNYDDRLAQKEDGLASDDDDVFDWILMLRNDQSDAAIYQFCDGEDGCESRGHQDGVPFVILHGSEANLAGIIRRHTGQVEFVEPSRKIGLPNPVIEDDVQPASGLWNLDRIGVNSARNTGKGVNIYVFDTGVHVSHRDFGGRAKPAIDTMQDGRVIDCTKSSSSRCAGDTDGHGTHCAGTAAGTRYGVAKQATIWAAKVCCGRNTNILGGFDWVIRNGRKPGLITMSLGGPGNSNADKRGVDNVVNRGISVIVAAGNENDDTCRYTFGFVPNAISVGSTDSRDRRSGFSNFGSCNDIYAPGSRILSAKTGTSSGSTTLSGTSMACPAVAGGAALLLERNPSQSPSALKRALRDNAEKGKLSGMKSGDPNMLLSVGGGGGGPPPRRRSSSPPPRRRSGGERRRRRRRS